MQKETTRIDNQPVLATLPSSLKDDPWMVPGTVGFALYARDFAAAKEILSQDRDSWTRLLLN
jgi:hypothetical protein